MNKSFFVTIVVACAIIGVFVIAFLVKTNTQTTDMVQPDADMTAVYAHSYVTCMQTPGSVVLGAEENRQCAADGFVYFENEFPEIELVHCTRYFDGCNSSRVEQGLLTGTTKKICSEEVGSPTCFVQDEPLQTILGTITYVDVHRLDIDTNGETTSFTSEEDLYLVDIFSSGQTVRVDFTEEASSGDKKILTVMEYSQL